MFPVGKFYNKPRLYLEYLVFHGCLPPKDVGYGAQLSW